MKVKTMNDQLTPDVLVLVLTNGDQLVGEIVEQGGAYLATNVLQILTQVSESTGQLSMGITDYLPFCDPTGGFAIPTNLAIVGMPSEELLAHYNRRFGKIITPPTPKIILG